MHANFRLRRPVRGPSLAVTAVSSARSGRVPTALLLGLLLVGFAGFVAWVQRAVEASGHHAVDAARVRIEDPGWVPPDWEARVAARLAALGPIEARERAALERAAAEIRALPFVAEIGEVGTIWPDGFAVDVRLRRPRACVRSGDRYVCIAGDGTVLPGTYALPPHTGRGFLPVLGPRPAEEPAPLPGERLEDEAARDGLSIATSMHTHLGPADLERIGIVLIDAREATRASVENPGAVLWLEDRRLVLFGRAPRADAPGELPASEKWRHLAAAFERLADPAAGDWDLLDARWDRAVLRPRVTPEEAEAWAPR